MRIRREWNRLCMISLSRVTVLASGISSVPRSLRPRCMMMVCMQGGIGSRSSIVLRWDILAPR